MTEERVSFYKSFNYSAKGSAKLRKKYERLKISDARYLTPFNPQPPIPSLASARDKLSPIWRGGQGVRLITSSIRLKLTKATLIRS